MALSGNVVVAQGGGPTAVINESLVGVVLESRKFAQIKRVYGAVGGVRGIIGEEFLDLTQETTHNLEEVAKTPSSALLSTRDKPDEQYCKHIFEVFRAHDVRYFFYIGGNDSVGTVDIVNNYARLEGYDFRAIHIPKTIDNDIVHNDHTPGYGSAAKFVAQSFIGLNLDNRALPGVHIGVVMGRHSGFLTASSVLAKKYPDDGPHLVYLPERAFELDKFASDVKKVYDKYGRCVVAVSEGIADKDGIPIAQKLGNVERDAYGNVFLSNAELGDLLANHIKRLLKIERVRADTFGYLQRSFGLCISEVDQHEAREAGEKAAQFAIWHDIDGSITLNRIGDYAIDYGIRKLGEVSNRTRTMDEKFINGEGNHVTESFKNYVRPLVGSNLKQGQRLIAPPVKKIIGQNMKALQL
ncbi:6-phosphofructokinase 1 [Peptoclostridium litorale DSM 5388]|uniref:Pyrophosphate--fructose 6-phosphate 1-phosphotransferase n=1 Tax=Peptoclostridium litorale DSM 5388 TaxID=1121324 RepID=A0A069RFL1_PEPLI|nr:6-phosphofructokinase [Peptoclostridium litorale]KDR95568.1 phosphofructokinase [Peptoclostridium litorale DSM 5388]SIN98461.1 6-phosphofructokinase 1 [Peptoclostridium litorale DSM 5388]